MDDDWAQGGTQHTDRLRYTMRLTIRIVALSLVAMLTGCGAAGSASGGSSQPASGPSSGNDQGGPTAAYIQGQFAQQVNPIASDAAMYRRDVAAANDSAVISDAGTLYSEIATLPLVLANAQLFGVPAQQFLPAVKSAATRYAAALNNVNGGTPGHLAAVEAKVKPADQGFRLALQAFASQFGGTVPTL